MFREQLSLNNIVLGTILEVKIGEVRKEIIEAIKHGLQEVAKHLKDHRERNEKLED